MTIQGRSKRTLRTILVALSLVLSGLVGVIGVATPASAAAGNILPPFNTGETWWICRGYNYASHTGLSSYGLDLTGGPGCNNSASGRTVRAPMSGTVHYYQASYGNLCVNVAGGRSYTLTHINSSVTGGPVSAGQVVGNVAPPGARGNANVAHIHFQMWSTPNCYSSSGIPFDSAHSTRICGAPDLTASGPNGGNGMWSGISFTGQACGSTTPPPLPPSPPPWDGVKNTTFLGTDKLVAGQTMHANEYILSEDGRFVLAMQTDGNLVEYTSTGAIWWSGTSGHPGAYLAVQSDGNVVIYAANGTTPLWSTGTSAAASFAVQRDANVVAYAANGTTPLWNSGIRTSTNGLNYRSDVLTTGMTLVKYQYLRSSDRRYFALVQGDGNFVIYAPGQRVLWNSGTDGHPGAYLAVQSDGNVVIYAANGTTPLWSMGTSSVVKIAMQSDGNFVGYSSSDQPIWNTGTQGQL